jgi:hypothetical protein
VGVGRAGARGRAASACGPTGRRIFFHVGGENKQRNLVHLIEIKDVRRVNNIGIRDYSKRGRTPHKY